MKKIFKNPIFTFIIGAILFSTAGVIAATLFNATDIEYTGTSFENVDNVQGALDNLYVMASLYNDPESIDMNTLTSNTKKSVFASSKGVCLIRNNKLNCFKTNNWNVEKNRIQQVFSDVSCEVTNSYVFCNQSGVSSCRVQSNGNVDCHDNNDSSVPSGISECYAYSDGRVECDPEAQNSSGSSDVPIDPDTFQTNTAKTVYASNKGVCIKRNGKLNCFKINNWSEEQTHIKQVFSDVGLHNPSTGLGCYVDSSFVSCSASDFDCDVISNGGVSCRDYSDLSSCGVKSDGSVSCN